MALDALRSALRRQTTPAATLADGGPVEFAPAPADATADGGIDAVAFGCPSCGRTIARGARRCDGCGQRLILDVPMDRAARLVGAGTAAGVLATLLLVNLFGPGGGAAPAAARVLTGSGSGAAGSGAGSDPLVEISTGAAAALRGTTAINGRLASEAEPLAAALAAKSIKTTDVAKILRRMSVDTRAGAGMVKLLVAWPEAAGQHAALASFYDRLGAQIDAGLANSVKSRSAYKKTAKAVLATLQQIPLLDADARTLAAQAGVELLPVTFPAALE